MRPGWVPLILHLLETFLCWMNCGGIYIGQNSLTKKILLCFFFQTDQSLMTFEGQQMQGSAKIMEKINSLTFQKIAHLITSVDCQPTFDGGILINVLGQLKVFNTVHEMLFFIYWEWSLQFSSLCHSLEPNCRFFNAMFFYINFHILLTTGH